MIIMAMLAAVLVAQPAQVPTNDASYRIGVGAGGGAAIVPSTGVPGPMGALGVGLERELDGGGDSGVAVGLMYSRASARQNFEQAVVVLGYRKRHRWSWGWSMAGIGIGAGWSTPVTGIDSGLSPPPLGLALDLCCSPHAHTFSR